MRSPSSLICVISLAFLSAGVPALAHHGFAVEFDRNNSITVTGTVSRVEYMNPHIYFYLDVKGKDGKVVNWAFEGGPPNVLYRRGWKKDTVKAGDTLTVVGFRARDGSHLASCTTATFPDGRVISSASGTATQAGSSEVYK